jgi:phage/plasmid-like protein (TIGR03299 family)
MAHDLNYNEVAKRHAYFGVKKAAWHHLGVTVDQALSWEDAMGQALLDWEVEKYQFNSSLTGLAVDAYGIYRADTKDFLGAVGGNYTPIQNRYAFSFVDAILEADGHAHYESAGALGKGERIWCLAKVNGEIRIQGTDDTSNTYLLFTTSHDGSLAATCKLTTVRVVCNNTLARALTGKGAQMRVKHTQGAKGRLEEARRLMTGVNVQVKDIETKFNELAQRAVTKESFTSVMKQLFGDWEIPGANTTRTENKIKEIAQLFRSNDKDTIPEIKGSAYNLLNAITEYTDHYSPFRKTEARDGMTDDAIRSENALFGTGAALKEQALEVIYNTTSNDPRREIVRAYVTVPEMPAAGGSLIDSIIDDMQV